MLSVVKRSLRPPTPSSDDSSDEEQEVKAKSQEQRPKTTVRFSCRAAKNKGDVSVESDRPTTKAYSFSMFRCGWIRRAKESLPWWSGALLKVELVEGER